MNEPRIPVLREPFFYAPALPDGPRLTLGGDEARHAAAVQRLREGDALALFDGHGQVVRAHLVAVRARGREIELEVHERLSLPAPRPRVLLYCALPKGERVNVLLDMATQLGMSRFTPLVCARASVAPRATPPERWARICLEACKQSRRAHLPELAAPLSVAAAAEAAAAEGARLLAAHPDPQARAVPAATGEARTCALFIGPEGGFTAEEIARLHGRGAALVTLGPRVLRIETAAVALLAALTVAGS